MNQLDFRGAKQQRKKALVFSLMIFVVTLFIAWYVYYTQTQVLKNILASQSDRNKVNLTRNVIDLMSDLSSISKRWINDPEITEFNWRADARDFTERITGVHSVWFVDNNFECQWIVSASNSSQQRCSELLSDAEYVEKLNQIVKTQVVDFSRVYEVKEDKVIYLFKALGQAENFGGFIAIEVKVSDFIQHFLGDPNNSNYYTKAFTRDQEVFSNAPDGLDEKYVDDFFIDLDADEGAWLFKVYPTQRELDLIITKMPLIIAIAGGIISALFLMTLWSQQKAKQESKKWLAEIEEKEKVQFDLEYLANHDALTDLPNRHFITNFIERRVEFAVKNKHEFIILFIDLDHFKDVNDSLGHGVGDQLLKQLPVVFEQTFGKKDVIARMGGDEFVVYMPGKMDGSEIIVLIERFLETLGHPIQIDEHLIRLTGSVGVALYPQHGSNVTELLSHADAALYRAKDKGRNTFSIYDSNLEQLAKDRLKLSAMLHDANEKDEFEMYFQPRYDLNDAGMVGAEALIRWNSQSKGLVEPASFLHLLEETSLVVPISYRMLARSCVQFKELQNANPNLFLSFNVSARLLEHPLFIEQIKSILDDTHFPADRLEFELTEQVLIENVDNNQNILNKVKELGIKIAIDDFGTGYSSLSYLKNFPVDVLKIDKSFVIDIDDDSDDLELVKTMVYMGRNLKIVTVAEGVENLAQFKLLQDLGCDQAQGFHFSRPVSFDNLCALINGKVG